MSDQPGKRAWAEDLVLEREKQYQSMFENKHTVMLLIDPTDASIVDANPAAVDFYGYRREELKALKITDITILSHDEADQVFEKMKTQQECQFLFQHRLASGDIRHVEAYVGPTRIGLKYINYALVFDITEKLRAKEALQQGQIDLEQRVSERTAELKRANGHLRKEIEKRRRTEEELQKSSYLLQTIFDGITDPLIMVGADMSIKILNDAALKYYGVSETDGLAGECCFKSLRGEAKPCNDCQIPSAVLSGEVKAFERKGFVNPDRIEQVVIYPAKISERERTGAIIHISDITEEKLVQRQLIQSEKLASLGLLMSGIAHEINNPSNFITLNTPVMRDYMDEVMPIISDYANTHKDHEWFGMSYSEFREDIYKLLNDIEYGASRITSIVSDLREFARMEDTKKLVRISLEPVVERAIGICKSQIKKRVKFLDVSIQKDLPKILTNPKAVEQVLINLLVNAAQAADKEDSKIKLRVTLDKIPQSKVIIEVEDNGIGMDEKTKSKLFVPFFTTKKAGEGTGLGLYVSNSLIEGLGGQLELESEAGVGSIFRVILPKVENE